jgi:hypothetical protein
MNDFICSHEHICSDKMCPHKKPHKQEMYCEFNTCYELDRNVECRPMNDFLTDEEMEL